MSDEPITDAPPTPRWLHAWAIVTALAALPLLFLGAEVTSTNNALADPDGFTHFRDPLILVRQWREGTALERGLGYVVEHSHRLAGEIVGVCTIILALGLWFRGGRLRWLGPAVLAAVVVQGLLGAFSVYLHAILGPNLALIHGCAAQVVFAVLVSTVVVTSPRWDRHAPEKNRERTARLRRLAFALPVLVYAQLVLGAFVRHTDWPLASRLHVLTAFLVVAGAVWLLKDWLAAGRLPRGEKIAAGLLGLFLALQLALGVEALLGKFRVVDALTAEPLPPLLDPHWVRSLHYIFGAAVFSTAVVVALLLVWRGHAPVREKLKTPVHGQELEGVA